MSDQPQSDKSPAISPEVAARRKEYWKKNVRLVLILLSIWFAVSYLAGVIFADQLDTIHLFGFPLGFWFAQQGSIYVFVILIFVYARLMNRLDRQFDVHEK